MKKIPVLYGYNIDRDFSREFSYIEDIFGIKSDEIWDGTIGIDDKEYMNIPDGANSYFDRAYTTFDLENRFIHSTGKSSVEVLKWRLGIKPHIVDAVLEPDYSNVSDIIKNLKDSGYRALIYGGGTSVNGSFIMEDSEKFVSMDTSRLNKIKINGSMVTAGAGVRGAELEEYLNTYGLTCGQFPESFRYSTVGGWIATKAIGQESNLYGGIEDMVISLKAATSSGIYKDNCVPRESAGTEVKSIFTGSEGNYGIIMEATLKAFKMPAQRYYKSYIFGDFISGIEYIRSLKNVPTVLRFSDATETEIAIKSSGDTLLKRVFLNYLKIRHADSGCIMVMVNNDNKNEYRVKNAVYTGKYPAVQWFRDRYSRPGIASILWKHGYIPDTLETSAAWDDLKPLYESTIAVFNSIKTELKFSGIIMAHISHVYLTGACIYFTIIIRSDRPMEHLMEIRHKMVNNFLKNHAAITDHHGIGTLFREYLSEEELSLQSRLYDPVFSRWYT